MYSRTFSQTYRIFSIAGVLGLVAATCFFLGLLVTCFGSQIVSGCQGPVTEQILGPIKPSIAPDVGAPPLSTPEDAIKELDELRCRFENLNKIFESADKKLAALSLSKSEDCQIDPPPWPLELVKELAKVTMELLFVQSDLEDSKSELKAYRLRFANLQKEHMETKREMNELKPKPVAHRWC
jgi:hypothetical protein